MTGRCATLLGALTLVLSLGVWTLSSCDGGKVISDDNDGGAPAPPCKQGADKDGDGYGTGCDKGNDCDDNDPYVNPGVKESCNGKDDNCDGKKDEGVLNACGTCDQYCVSLGKSGAFPTTKDSNVKDAKGVSTDSNGDLVLDKTKMNFNYLWIANTYDPGGASCASSSGSMAFCRGTVSKVDASKLQEVARYYSLTCKSKAGTSGCTDINGKTLQQVHNQTPSRTAVDYNFDVWVANRNIHGGQPSATKIANDPIDCIDRNKNGKIDTSKDQNGDGTITVDCNSDGVADSLTTTCSGSYAGKSPEFLGDDDECILFTAAYGDIDDVGRSICLDMGKSMVGAGNAWVGTFYRPEKGRGNNRFYKIDGTTGKVEDLISLPSGHHSYGCMADAYNVVWSTDIYGSLAYFQTISPYSTGPKLTCPWYPKSASQTYHHYGIAIDSLGHVWLGGYDAYWVLRYKTKRDAFSSLAKGTWTRIDVKSGYVTRGIAVDNRGFVWVAIQDGGYVLRIEQSIGEGIQNRTTTPYVWPVKADTVIGAGVDFSGNVWAVGYKNGIASRLDVDKSGNVTATGLTKNVNIGQYPYTYSDFTGYGLMNFVRPQGRYVYQLSACPIGVKASWSKVFWTATTPANTSVTLRVRTGDSETTFGSWSSAFTASPANIGLGYSTAISPNPAKYIQVEFTLSNKDKNTSPILHDFGISYTCAPVAS